MKLKLLLLAVSSGVFIYPRVLYVIFKSYGKFDDIIEHMIREKSLNSEAAVVLLYEMERDKLSKEIIMLFRLRKVRDQLLWLNKESPFINHTTIKGNELSIGCTILMRCAVDKSRCLTCEEFRDILMRFSILSNVEVPKWLCDEIIRVTKRCVSA